MQRLQLSDCGITFLHDTKELLLENIELLGAESKLRGKLDIFIQRVKDDLIALVLNFKITKATRPTRTPPAIQAAEDAGW